jgi:hypothetical protein
MRHKIPMGHGNARLCRVGFLVSNQHSDSKLLRLVLSVKVNVKVNYVARNKNLHLVLY